jgi:hypothetical protein
MSTGSDPALPETQGLQFDHAEFEQATPSTVTCAACKRPIVDQYFEINGTIVCEPCKGLIASRLRGGSGFIRYQRALLFGTVAAVVGTLAYAASIWFSHVNLSLISIFVGYLIGRAVRAGSRNLGGILYQITAVLLTYLAIGATYTVIAFAELIQAADPRMPTAPLNRVILFVFSTIIAPIATVRESVIMIAIIGFALWQAWKMNVRLKLVVTGPYRVGETGPEGAFRGAPAHA